MNGRDFLLEIRLENIPARAVMSAEAQLEAGAARMLEAADASFGTIKAYGTYKRLVLHIGGLSRRGPGSENGPGRRVSAVKKASGRSMSAALSMLLPELVSGLRFRNTMVWERTRARFIRPVRGLLALYGEKVVPFSFAGIRSGRITEGLNAKGARPLSVPSAEKYFRSLEHANVIVRDGDRSAALAKELEQAAGRMKLEVEPDRELLEENTYLTEYPLCVVGAFSQEFMKLPAELLSSVMKERMKFFPVRDARKELQPYFVGVRDGVSRAQRNVQEGFQNALEASLRDAAFLRARGKSEAEK